MEAPHFTSIIYNTFYICVNAMYVNDIEIELIKQECQSYELNMFNLYLLIYADDTVLFSENVHELQNMINVVNVCSNE
jgi:hypothetical protein